MSVLDDVLSRWGFRRWFVFGERDGIVDVCDVEGDIATGIPKDIAEQLIQRHNGERQKVLEAMLRERSLPHSSPASSSRTEGQN